MRSAPFLLLAFLSTAVLHAASDTDVTIIEAKGVEIHEDRVVITARACTKCRVVDSEAHGDFLGRSAAWITVMSTDATFIVRKPQLNWNGPDGEEKARFERINEEGWQMTLDAAKDLKEGRETGRIGYYQPSITIGKSMIEKIEGHGFLYPKRDADDAE